MKDSLERFPTAFSKWSSALFHEVHPMNEIAIVGDEALNIAKTIQADFLPNKIMMATVGENLNYPLLENKIPEKDTYIYVCQNYTCKQPVKTVEAFYQVMNNER